MIDCSPQHVFCSLHMNNTKSKLESFASHIDFSLNCCVKPQQRDLNYKCCERVLFIKHTHIYTYLRILFIENSCVPLSFRCLAVRHFRTEKVIACLLVWLWLTESVAKISLLPEDYKSALAHSTRTFHLPFLFASNSDASSFTTATIAFPSNLACYKKVALYIDAISPDIR